MRAVALHGLVWLIVAIAPAPFAARAQDTGESAYASAPPPSDAIEVAKPDPALTPEEIEAASRALLFDPAGLAINARPSKPLKLPGQTAPKNLDVSGTDKPDGSTTVIVKKPLATEWDATIGADLNPAAAPPDTYQPHQFLAPAANLRGSGAAWASLGVSRSASLDARVDPTNEQGKLGATLKQPIGDRFSVTLQNTYSVTESPGAAAPPGLPLMTAPPVTNPAAPPGTVWGDEKNVKFNIAPTGTTFGAGLTSTSTDPVTHNTLSAEQKLYGPLHITTAVTDVGQTGSSKSISAGLKLRW